MVTVGSVAMSRLLLAAVLFVRVSYAEWVEIPHLKPSSSISSSSSSSTTIKPITPSINTGGHGAAVAHSHRLLSHLADERDAGDRWSHQHRSPVRWHHRPVSDLLDYDRPTKRVSSPWITGDPDTPVALVNVTSKVEEMEETSEAEASAERDEQQFPVVQTELLPFGNRYEEESIETGTAADGSKAIRLPVHHFDDFDDYDERLFGPQTNAPPASEETDYTEEAEDDDKGNETVEEAEQEEDHFMQHTPPPNRKAQLRPQQPTGFGGFIEFLRRMQASFVQRTAHSIGDKIRTLAGMRDQLLSTIERRIASLWVGSRPTPMAAGRRVKRGWMEPHGGDTDAMDFPSAEGALLTISFLTFAVFLIKLVLQVINTIKAKHYTYSTFAAATPVSGGLLVKRTRRHLEPRDIQAILGTVDGYRPV
ncbi:uncharacterized protein LOC126568213 [Anopheles maculipalpis]|uniref:uncharacterized protein LOC126568213 n=1 Tax=Anopheles maculipalpis TaxID=1496333 RepID=UPI0021595DB5|nr:uncharacterized protein LOC126568213 [Anopheles maculipalpis]